MLEQERGVYTPLAGKAQVAMAKMLAAPVLQITRNSDRKASTSLRPQPEREAQPRLQAPVLLALQLPREGQVALVTQA